MSVYHELLEIKQFRETQAETEVRRASRAGGRGQPLR